MEVAEEEVEVVHDHNVQVLAVVEEVEVVAVVVVVVVELWYPLLV